MHDKTAVHITSSCLGCPLHRNVYPTHPAHHLYVASFQLTCIYAKEAAPNKLHWLLFTLNNLITGLDDCLCLYVCQADSLYLPCINLYLSLSSVCWVHSRLTAISFRLAEIHLQFFLSYAQVPSGLTVLEIHYLSPSPGERCWIFISSACHLELIK